MLYEKMNLAKKPFSKKYSFRRKHWYLFPQRWTWRKSVAEVRYNGTNDSYIHDHFWLIYAYHFSWLFIDVHWELKMDERLSVSEYRHEPITHISPDGTMFKAH